MAEFTAIEQMQLTEGMSDQQKFMFNAEIGAKRKDRMIMLVISIFLGHFGVDRFMLGDIGIGLLKLFSCGGFGIWTLIDWFLIMGRTDEYNRQEAHQIAMRIRGAAPPGY